KQRKAASDGGLQAKSERRSFQVLRLRILLPGQAVPGFHRLHQQDRGEGIRETAQAELERAAAGLPTEQKAKRIRRVSEVVKVYLDGYRLTHRPSSVDFASTRLGTVERLLGTTVLSDLTEERMRDYVRQRQADGASGRTINMELGELSRAIGRT